MDPAIVGLNNKMKELAIRRQKGSSVLKTASWALYHRSEFKELIENITSLIDNIETLFPAPQSQLALVKQETAAIQNKQALKLVESAAQDVDSLLQAAAKEALTGHQYLNIVITGKAHTGEAFSSNWKGEAKGASHKYNGVEVDKDGKALMGNSANMAGSAKLRKNADRATLLHVTILGRREPSKKQPRNNQETTKKQPRNNQETTKKQPRNTKTHQDTGADVDQYRQPWHDVAAQDELNHARLRPDSRVPVGFKIQVSALDFSAAFNVFNDAIARRRSTPSFLMERTLLQQRAI